MHAWHVPILERGGGLGPLLSNIWMALFALLACLFVVAKKIKLPLLPKGGGSVGCCCCTQERVTRAGCTLTGERGGGVGHDKSHCLYVVQ